MLILNDGLFFELASRGNGRAPQPQTTPTPSQNKNFELDQGPLCSSCKTISAKTLALLEASQINGMIDLRPPDNNHDS
jgi:hypothetical protein